MFHVCVNPGSYHIWGFTIWALSRENLILLHANMSVSVSDIMPCIKRDKPQAVYILCQGLSYLPEVGARGLLNLGKKQFGPSKLE